MPLERKLYFELLSALSQLNKGESDEITMKNVTLGDVSTIQNYLSKKDSKYEASLTDYGLKISKKEKK